MVERTENELSLSRLDPSNLQNQLKTSNSLSLSLSLSTHTHTHMWATRLLRKEHFNI